MMNIWFHVKSDIFKKAMNISENSMISLSLSTRGTASDSTKDYKQCFEV